MRSSEVLKVTTDAVDAQGRVPVQFTASGARSTPRISWSGVPTETKQIEVLVEDPDAPGSTPYVHLLLEGLAASTPSTSSPGTFGPNSAGGTDYAALDPPPGKSHHYHFEVFALDRPLPTVPVGRDGLIKAMMGHVVAKGEVVGVYGR